MDYLYNLLKGMEKRPGMYIGSSSIERLKYALDGYIMRYIEYDKINNHHFLSGFQEFIENKYENDSFGVDIKNKHWLKIIEIFGTLDERYLFNEFYTNLHEYEISDYCPFKNEIISYLAKQKELDNNKN